MKLASLETSLGLSEKITNYELRITGAEIVPVSCAPIWTRHPELRIRKSEPSTHNSELVTGNSELSALRTMLPETLS